MKTKKWVIACVCAKTSYYYTVHNGTWSVDIREAYKFTSTSELLYYVGFAKITLQDPGYRLIIRCYEN